MFQKICIAKINLEFTDECVEQKKKWAFLCVCVCVFYPSCPCVYIFLYLLSLFDYGEKKKKGTNPKISDWWRDGNSLGGEDNFRFQLKKKNTPSIAPPPICIFKIHSFPPFSWISNHVLHPTFSHWHSMFVRFVSILTPPIRLFFFFFLLTSPLSFPS